MIYFQAFQADIKGISTPDKFTFPFYYEPHPLTSVASNELQDLLEKQVTFKHNLGTSEKQGEGTIGKMFGVLIVANQAGELGYLAAYSGKIDREHLPDIFVPPVYDVHAKDSFFSKATIELNALNKKIKSLEEAPPFLAIQAAVSSQNQAMIDALANKKEWMRNSKKDRKVRREAARLSLSAEAFIPFNAELAKESIKGQQEYRKMAYELKEALLKEEAQLAVYTSEIAALKQQRKKMSGHLQRRIFDQYQFLNQEKEAKGLTEIFPKYESQKPPSGAGECCAPKLLQYAFQQGLKPIAMGEFWWGKSPITEIRKHKHFYPACGGRCKPILGHMLAGIELEENLLLKNPSENKELAIVFEDDHMLIINKPAEFLSVPGKSIRDSVYSRMLAKYPDATGPLIVHRLDMSTSGILVIAKTKEAHKAIQSQFIKRTIKKRYVALLDGEIEGEKGQIDLPLRVDLDDRPRQLVCDTYGKAAKTIWKVKERSEGKTRVHLFPITGRTHQLRVHVSHPLGLNTAIVGDDLYGKKADRLHLHAEYIAFLHPFTNKKISFKVKADF